MKQSTLQLRAWPYFALVYAITWACWGAAALSGQSLASPLAQALIGIGGLGPAIAGIALAHRAGGDFWRDYWQRLTQLKRIRPAWWCVILLLAPGLATLAAGLDRLLGGPGLALEIDVARSSAGLFALASLALFTFFFGPLPEELGWRGYVLDRLLARHRPLIASLILGGLWALWHAPLFFVADSYQSRLGASAWGVGSFAAAILAQTVLMTWVHLNTQRSTLAAVLFHYAVNLTGELLALSPRGEACYTTLWLLMASVVILGWRERGFLLRIV